MGVSKNTTYKWLKRYREEGIAGLHNRSSCPRHSPRATAPDVCETVEALRRQRQGYEQIAQALGLATSTVGRLLKKRGLNRLAALEPAPLDNHYEHQAPGRTLVQDTVITAQPLGSPWAMLSAS